MQWTLEVARASSLAREPQIKEQKGGLQGKLGILNPQAFWSKGSIKADRMQ